MHLLKITTWQRACALNCSSPSPVFTTATPCRHHVLNMVRAWVDNFCNMKMASSLLVTETSCEPKRRNSMTRFFGRTATIQKLCGQNFIRRSSHSLLLSWRMKIFALSVGSSNSCFARLDSTFHLYVLILIVDDDVYAWRPHFLAGPTQTCVSMMKTPSTFFSKCSLRWNSRLFVLIS